VIRHSHEEGKKYEHYSRRDYNGSGWNPAAPIFNRLQWDAPVTWDLWNEPPARCMHATLYQKRVAVSLVSDTKKNVACLKVDDIDGPAIQYGVDTKSDRPKDTRTWLNTQSTNIFELITLIRHSNKHACMV
jgi:hypothetical protein